jgi:hypothetical protein
MPTPIRVSYVKRSIVSRFGVEGPGGRWRDRPWYQSERRSIEQIDKSSESREWDFFLHAGFRRLPHSVS